MRRGRGAIYFERANAGVEGSPLLSRGIMDIKKAIFERGDLRVDHLIVGRPCVECVAVGRLNVTASFESMDARLEDAELHDSVLLVMIDALDEVRVLSTPCHRELENTRVDVVLDAIE